MTTQQHKNNPIAENTRLTRYLKISVVVPVYNSACYLRLLLEALGKLETEGQTLEIILVDDGSTDESVKIIEGYPVKLIRQPNAGPARARNTGWREATGDLIFFTDADCVPPPHWITRLLLALAEPMVGAAAGSYDIANPQSRLARFIQAEILSRHRRMPRHIKTGGSYNLAIPKKVLEELGGFDERFPTASAEDNDMCYRIQKAGYCIVFCPQARVAHHHPTRLWPYLKTQFGHGYWRNRLYRSHPEFMAGDDYTRFRDVLEVVLAALSLALAPLAFVPRREFLLPLVAVVMVLLLSEGWWATLVCKENGETILAPFGFWVLMLRGYTRTFGWLTGAVGISFKPKRNLS